MKLIKILIDDSCDFLCFEHVNLCIEFIENDLPSPDGPKESCAAEPEALLLGDTVPLYLAAPPRNYGK